MQDEPRVTTYEAGADGLVLVGRHPSLSAASAALPQGAYTTLRTYGGRSVVRLDQHRRRLEESVALQGRPASLEPAAARRAIRWTLDATGHPESRLRLTFAPPRLFLSIEPFTPVPERLYEEGVACVTLDVRRENPHAKDTRFIATAQGAYDRLPAGVEEGLILGDDGAILEGLSSNFFGVVDGVLRTEEERALGGVTRSLVLEVAEGLMPIGRRAVHRDELPRVTEALVTSVSREVLPVVRVDGLPLGDGRVGEKTRRIMGAFADLVRREVESL
ncbi:MAG TPA: aminotransferase class IV [Vicinamibacteria bacterium]|nr:aminotransferase class IV [Vicinamibacteria bacterium]